MPQYTPVPYVRERRPRNLRLADLYLRQGEQIADSERRSGEIKAQLWGNVGQAVGQAASTAIMAPTMQREADAKAKQEAQRAELGDLQLGAARRDVNDRENFDLAMGQGSRAKTLEALKGRPELYEKAQAHFGKIDTSLKQLFTNAAEGIADFGYTPEAANAALDDLVENGFDPKRLEQFRQAFSDPTKIRSVVDGILGKTPVVPKTREIKVTNPDGTETIRVVEDTPGQEFTSTPPPKAPGSIEQQISDALARGDQEAVTRLTRAAELASDARRAPPGPPTERAKFWVMRNGNPIRISEAEYQPGDTPASTREQGRPVTSGDAGKFTDLDTSLDDVSVLRTAISGTGSTGTAAKIGANVPNWVTEYTGWGSDAKKKQALIDRVKQVIGKALEEGVLRKEDELKYSKILPTVGDPNELVISKLDGLEDALRKKKQRHLDSLTDAGYDTSKFTARDQAPKEGATTEFKVGGFTVKVKGQ